MLQYRREMQKVPEASCLTPSAAVSCDTANFILHHVAGLLDGAFLLFLNTTFSYKAVSPVSAFPEGNHLDTTWEKNFEIKICLALSIHIFLKKRIISYTATKGWNIRKPLSLSLPAEILSHQLKCIDIVMRQ